MLMHSSDTSTQPQGVPSSSALRNPPHTYTHIYIYIHIVGSDISPLTTSYLPGGRAISAFTYADDKGKIERDEQLKIWNLINSASISVRKRNLWILRWCHVARGSWKDKYIPGCDLYTPITTWNSVPGKNVGNWSIYSQLLPNYTSHTHNIIYIYIYIHLSL